MSLRKALSRHSFVPFIALVFLLSFSACLQGTDNNENIEINEEHILSRAGYGPDSWSLNRIQEKGPEQYLLEQLDPAELDDSHYESLVSTPEFLTLGLSLKELYENYCDGCSGGPFYQPLYELMGAKVLRSVYSHRQVEAVLTDFWFDHFNVLGWDGFGVWSTTPYERDAIRPFVLGKFGDMLLATARHPAMLYYLDNYRNFREGFQSGGYTLGINENYARELLELHTVGVDGGYDQQDIIDVARCLTGWTIDYPGLTGDDGSGFIYYDPAHDKESKSVSIAGETLFIPENGGYDDGVQVINFLANHPATAHRISRLLIERFVSEDPPQALIETTAATFLASGGDLRQVMTTILTSYEFLGNNHVRHKIKKPLVYVTSLIRATEVSLPPDQLIPLVEVIYFLGEGLYGARAPTGYPDESGYWLNPGTFVNRLNMSFFLTGSYPPYGLSPSWSVPDNDPEGLVDALIARIHPNGISTETRMDLINFVDALDSTSLDQKTRQAAAMVFSSPEFMTH